MVRKGPFQVVEWNLREKKEQVMQPSGGGVETDSKAATSLVCLRNRRRLGLLSGSGQTEPCQEWRGVDLERTAGPLSSFLKECHWQMGRGKHGY